MKKKDDDDVGVGGVENAVPNNMQKDAVPNNMQKSTTAAVAAVAGSSKSVSLIKLTSPIRKVKGNFYRTRGGKLLE